MVEKLMICKRCGLIAQSEEEISQKFIKDERIKSGFMNVCKNCRKKADRQRYRNRHLSISYQKRQFYLTDLPKPTKCQGCGRSINGEIKHLAHHHWLYKYSKNKVIENPKLALENTVVVCYPCHRIADALRELYEVDRWERICTLLESMPSEFAMEIALNFRRLDDLISEWLKKRGYE